jgi:hypothetical protein
MRVNSVYDRREVPSLDSIKDALAPILENGRAERAIVFGSYGRGEADEYSDLDLIVVAASRLPFLRRHQSFGGIHRVWPGPFLGGTPFPAGDHLSVAF